MEEKKGTQNKKGGEAELRSRLRTAENLLDLAYPRLTHNPECAHSYDEEKGCDCDVPIIRSQIEDFIGTKNSAAAEPVLESRWRHANGFLMCGTLRIAREDFDTDPDEKFKRLVFDQIVNALNAEPDNKFWVTEFAKFRVALRQVLFELGDKTNPGSDDRELIVLVRERTRFSNQRLADLIRYCRSELHEANLITDDEYATIAQRGSESARRLEDYDALRKAHEEHLRHVGEFLSELYAIMIDPLADGELKVRETCEALLKQARADREKLEAGK